MKIYTLDELGFESGFMQNFRDIQDPKMTPYLTLNDILTRKIIITIV